MRWVVICSNQTSNKKKQNDTNHKLVLEVQWGSRSWVALGEPGVGLYGFHVEGWG